VKVRWRRGSFRLRVGPSELEALQRGEPVREELAFPGGASWTASIVPGDAPTTIGLQGNEARVALSRDDVVRLAAPDVEGVYFESSDDARGLRFFIEKDFPCLHPRPPGAAEAPEETFDAPADFASRHCRDDAGAKPRPRH